MSEREAEKLFDAVNDFKQKGIAVLYISHRMSEVELLCDRAVVLRDGLIVSTLEAPMDRKAIASSILGDLILSTEHVPRPGRDVAVRVTEMRAHHDSPSVSFEVRRGEILGLTGLIGAGKTEILAQVTGHHPMIAGRVEFDGIIAVRAGRVDEAMRNGIVMVSEERALQSIFPSSPIWQHCTIGVLGEFSSAGLMRRSREITFTEEVVRDFNVMASGPHADIADLSGGNQQKLLVGRWMRRDWRLLVLDEPYRGIDIGARGLISRALRQYSEDVPVIVCSSDPEEVIEIADRVIIMVDGAIVHEDSAGSLNAEQLADIISQGAAAGQMEWRQQERSTA